MGGGIGWSERDYHRPTTAGILYFALVFGASFVLGTIRTLWVVPRGTRTAELMEVPIMLAVTIVAARWRVLHLLVPMIWPARLELAPQLPSQGEVIEV